MSNAFLAWVLVVVFSSLRLHAKGALVCCFKTLPLSKMSLGKVKSILRHLPPAHCLVPCPIASTSSSIPRAGTLFITWVSALMTSCPRSQQPRRRCLTTFAALNELTRLREFGVETPPRPSWSDHGTLLYLHKYEVRSVVGVRPCCSALMAVMVYIAA